jgi:transcriptional regulator with XRE-family HTH domain
MKHHPLTLARAKLGLGMVELADKLGIDLSTVSRWEHGKRAYPKWAQRLISLLLKSKEAREHYGIGG